MFQVEEDFIGHIALPIIARHLNIKISVIHLRTPILTLIHRRTTSTRQLTEGKNDILRAYFGEGKRVREHARARDANRAVLPSGLFLHSVRRFLCRQYYGYQETGGGGGPGGGGTAGGPGVVDYQPPPPPPGEYPLPPYYGGYPPPPPPPANPAYLHSQGRPFVDREYLFV